MPMETHKHKIMLGSQLLFSVGLVQSRFCLNFFNCLPLYQNSITINTFQQSTRICCTDFSPYLDATYDPL